MDNLDFSQFQAPPEPRNRRVMRDTVLPILSVLETLGTAYASKGKMVTNSAGEQQKFLQGRSDTEEQNRYNAVDRALKLRQIQSADEENTAKRLERQTNTSEKQAKADREQKYRERSIQIMSLPEAERKSAAEKLYAELEPEGYTKSLISPEKKLTDQNIFNQENQLRNQYGDLTKDFRTIRDAYSRINVSANNPSPAGDLSLIFSYMKILDPGSTVREGEFANAQNAGSVSDRVVSMYNRALNGQRLSESQRADFISRSKDLYKSSENQYIKTRDQFKKIAGQYEGLDPSRVIVDYLNANPDSPLNPNPPAPPPEDTSTIAALKQKAAAGDLKAQEYLKSKGIAF